MTTRTLTTSLLSACALGLIACGDDEPARTTSATQEAPAPATDSGAARSCPDVQVPGHLAENVVATGLACDATVPIANMAEGLGRAAYKSGGFACEPKDAADGKTNYTCTKGEAKLTFLYG